MDAAEAVLVIRKLMKVDDDMKLTVATLLAAHGAGGLGQLAIENPELVVSLAESWDEMEADPAYSGNPETGKAWE